MLKKMILINAAEFDYLEIDLEKDLFFAGDNGTGKTTSIIALFYLFSGDNHSRKLGISSDKKSFKEYYFPDERNSYLIYIFQDFFILMYRQSGEIVKYFSKQQFQLEAMQTGDGGLQDLKEIRRFVKSAPLYHLVKSTDAYRRIIYGQNHQFLDFKITDIKHYDIFIDLFGQTFNVDKSIVDAKSIKMAIQKSINQGDSAIEFNYQNYMDEIKKFQDIYLFFRKFEKEEARIDEAALIKDKLLSSEISMQDIEASILYRRGLETSLLEKHQKERSDQELLKIRLQKQESQKQIFLNRCQEKYFKEKGELKSVIVNIEKLRKKFSPQAYTQKQNLFHKLPQLERERAEKQKQKILLESDIESATESIEREIRSLQYRYDTELITQKQERKRQAKREFDDGMDIHREQLRQAGEVYEHRAESDKQSLRHQIEEAERVIEEKKSETSRLYELYREKLDSFKKEKAKERQKYIEESEKSEQKLRLKKREEEEIAEQQERADERFALDKRNLVLNLLDERKYLNAKLREKRAILHTPIGSFKEFLQQSDISWERELYPFMDASLLSLPINQLHPKVINSESPLGIELSMENLKQIPTQEEAEESIRRRKKEKRELIISYKEAKSSLKSDYRQKLEGFSYQAAAVTQVIEELKNNIAQYGKKILMITEREIPQMLKNLTMAREEESSKIEQKIDLLQESIQAMRISIDKLGRKMQAFYLEQKEKLKQYQSNLNKIFKQETGRIEEWLHTEQSKVLDEIKNKNESRKIISKDAKLIDLSDALELLKPKLANAREAEHYLREYEEQQPLMQSYEAKKSRLTIIAQNKKNFEERIAYKKEQIASEISHNDQKITELRQEMKRFAEGLEKSWAIEIESEAAEESSSYLVDLVKIYQTLKTDYREESIKLQALLMKLNSFKINPFAEIAFNLANFSQFEKLSEDSETIERLNDLKEFKDKKLDPLKQTNNQAYLNFIKNEIPSKLGTLSHSEDKFEKQVRKINKNLSLIDFSIVKDIKIVTEIGNKKSVMKLLNDIKELAENLSISDPRGSLFFDRPQTNQDLQKIGNLLSEIKANLNGGAITLLDTIDLALEFTENGKQKTGVTQIKNESSTGGTILLKMALAVSILGLYTDEKESTFFLILDEVSRLHSHNQDILRSFANSRGFRIVFVTPEPMYAKPDEIRYYKFQRRSNNRFEAISLNHTRMH